MRKEGVLTGGGWLDQMSNDQRKTDQIATHVFFFLIPVW